jgi:hypothetical protein
MNKLFLFLLAGVIFSAGYFSYAQEIPKAWSIISEDNTSNAIPTDLNYIYKEPVQTERYFDVQNGRAVVYPNYRPFGASNTTQSELSIDIHPLNDNIIFASANATNWPFSTIWGTGIYFTLDGGTNWTGYDNPPFGTNKGDPASAIGTNGYFYEGFITNAYGQGAAVSTNNGVSWTTSVISTVPSTSYLLDKNHLWIDKKVGSPYENRVYSTWTRFQTGHVNNNKVEVSYSSDNGLTWSTPYNVSAGVNALSHDQGVNLQTGPNGEVYATWAIYDQWAAGVYGEDAIGFNVSTDGGQTWGTARRIYSAANFGIRGKIKPVGSPSASTGIRVSSFPSMGVNRSNGAIFITWPQKTVAPAGTSPDIVMISSFDGGLTWTAPVRVNDDPIDNGKDQYYPWLTVDQTTGHVYTVFYDSRNVANDSAEVYITRSIDGGLTHENIKASDAKFKPKPISGLAGGYQGDYIGITALNNTVYPYWADDRTGNYQAWIAKATFGPNIVHTPLDNTENLNGPYVVNTSIYSTMLLDLSKTKVYFWRDNGPKDSVLLTPLNQTDFTANIPGNGSPAMYHYYISAEDETGGLSTLPGGAPANYFSFDVATDLIAPSVAHTVIPDQLRENWPAMVMSQVTDNIGIDSVWVTYKINFSGITRTFGLENTSDNNFAGYFNIDTSLISLGDTLYYRIVARDVAAAQNMGYHPSSTNYNKFVFIPDTDLPVIVHNVLRDQPIIRWPAEVKAVITDPLGISSASVEFKHNNGSVNTFNLVNTSGDSWSGQFTVTQVAIGDSVSYRIKAVDNSTSGNVSYLPVSGYYNFKIIDTKAIVLVVNDDVTLEARVSEKGGESDLRSALGASSSLIINTLQLSGYTVDSVQFAALDVSTLGNYDILVLSSGTRTTVMFDDQIKRTAVVNFNINGGKVFVEGGEVGWFYRQQSTEKDVVFRRQILKDSSWVSDISTAVPLKKKIPHHQIFNWPNVIEDPITTTGSGVGPRDAMRTMAVPGVYKLATWEGTYADTAGIIAYSPTNDTNYVTNIFCTFALSAIVDQVKAANLIDNLFDYLTFGVIPVELTLFEAVAAENGVSLSWQTATETNNSGFEIERKSEGSSFENIGFVPGMGTTTRISSYSFVDDNITSGKFVYRLKQVDYDGTSSYSKEIEVEVHAPSVFELSQNYPNPFNPSTSIKFSVPQDGLVSLIVYNLLGEKIATLINQDLKAGRHEVKFDASKIASGLYFYRLDAGEFSMVKKMMLLK